MRILVCGAGGQVGRELAERAASFGLDVLAPNRTELDIVRPEQIAAAMAQRPGLIINAAAYTHVDNAESHSEQAYAVNRDGARNLAEAAGRAGVPLFHISTDYVFPGDGDRPYTEEDAVGPVSAYGRTKLRGEEHARSVESNLVVRTAWLYGRGGRNFIEAIRRQIDGGAEELKVVADQHGCPTFCDDLASAMLDLAEVDAQGIFHVVNSGETTWHGFASEVARLLGSNIPIEPVTTQAFPRPAPRPAYSVLGTTKVHTLLGRPMPTWQDALVRYLQS